ncbi:UDP-N-acetylmuramoylalanine/D-glutamate ligase [Elusimicrobium minutum Pei191]|uniref:UDP-N-acetylmuramoylalanine--D-glutamate ligase n=1 Tax=Elusimicrobium minutum (strain Pei191) TaxID=445932 RepID=MURD_ELUMP|nr:UDP-N-acetylmuramoyl-L-alanine--D-glutamate ligase [Elusimicrobium minutum]B2KEW4.1 RecName: Full=UDP-N-acetylmuramoylalanine--D-glutamate ligase; AltName: Full=D-glutamic acid-adding enzyme; AltName: Full=UDP-N-acetylmuramoyl-L-alanyl-D-glutamate synthetase [Elusimicrobium minutum Pei191]ACC99060.1 UDP-N-acetylmuramoylalanine/D-glutamate ligase [Elusimicrobium minutum Pei191]
MFKSSKFKGKKACVLGMGKSGLAAARLLAENGFSVLISDGGKREIPGNLHKNIEVETGGHTNKILDCGFIVKSPGISSNMPVLKKIKNKKIPIFSEIEISISFLPKGCRIFAVTGTNGKTTTTMLLSEILKQFIKNKEFNKNVFTVGNIGCPLAEVMSEIKQHDLIVMEVSSYQLEDSSYFKPYAATILNITPDHIDHHGSFKKYLDAKSKIFKFQTQKDIAVINSADKNCLKAAKNIKSKLYGFATTPLQQIRSHVFYDGDELVFSAGERISPPKLPGIHNVENAMAASLLALAAGVDSQSIQQAFNKFKTVEHRIELLGIKKGISFINDSKATNIDSTIIALRSMPDGKKTWLILGGQDKGSPYGVLLPLLETKCKKVLLVGQAAAKIKKDLPGYKYFNVCGTIDKAVEYAFNNAQKEDIILLSPACASFDQFNNFEERGKFFKQIYKSL